MKEQTDFAAAGGTSKARVTELDPIDVFKGYDKFCELNDIEVLVPKPDTIPYGGLGRDSISLEYDIEFREHKRTYSFQKT